MASINSANNSQANLEKSKMEKEQSVKSHANLMSNMVKELGHKISKTTGNPKSRLRKRLENAKYSNDLDALKKKKLLNNKLSKVENDRTLLENNCEKTNLTLTN